MAHTAIPMGHAKSRPRRGEALKKAVAMAKEAQVPVSRCDWDEVVLASLFD